MRAFSHEVHSMRKLLAATSLTPLLMIAPAPAVAETLIATAITTPVLTSTTNDNVRISTAGSVKPTSGAAVTINTNNSVNNEGTIAITGANDATGILANTNLTANIANSGTITIDENYTPTDTDNDGDVDGTFAQGSGRYGIHILGGGTFTGNITNSGAITIEGNQSAAIAVDSALAGSIIATGGAVGVLGDNSFGLHANAVSGDVKLTGGTIAVRGANSVAVALDGNIGGALVLQNAISSTGYRSTTAPADTSKLDADDLLQGGSAVRISGNVGGGILFDRPPADNSTTDTDEDDDGVADANESISSISTYGSAPAIAIGSSTQNVIIGAVAGSTDGIVMRGNVGASGVYSGVSATGLWIGGGSGRTVAVTGGLSNSGTILAGAANADSTALRIGSGTSVPTITNSGSIQSLGGGTDTTRSTAILIDSGANVGTIRNSGTISAQLGKAKGTAGAIVDNSGTLTLIENKGTIAVASAPTLGEQAMAIDVRANNTGVTLRQQLATGTAPAPAIGGNILFGAGSDVFDLADGTVNGAVRFGAGDNQLLLSGDAILNGAVSFGAGTNTVQLAGTSKLNGNMDFGGAAATLALTGTSALRGNLLNSGAVSANVGAGSTLDATNAGNVNLASLTTGTGSALGVTIGNNAATSYVVAGGATIGANTNVNVGLSSLDGIAGTYTILTAGTLTGASNLTTQAAALPFLYSGTLSTATPNQVKLTVGLKSADQLGINASESAILGAVIEAADSDAPIASAFLGVQDGESLQAALQQMLPEHAGGAFENVTKGSRLTTKMFADPGTVIAKAGGMGLWAQQVAWGSSKSIGSTSSYKLGGWGASGGVETPIGNLGNVGLSLSYFSGKDRLRANEIVSSQFEGGAYWRGGTGPLRGFARATAGRVSFDGTRHFDAVVGGTAITRETDGGWKGRLCSAAAGVSYEARMGRLSLRPLASIEHFSLNEDGYTEAGGGTAFDLIVDKRKSSETAANATLNIGYDLGSMKPDDGWMRVELEAGRRQILSGELGKTTARFANGTPFTLAPEDRTSGWLAALRLTGGGNSMSVTGEISAEQQQGKPSIGGRLGLQLPL
jgi:hypothetical protein